ncbi:hypothetical protein N657DRAFT_647376 [Parathielavia appendiculata]|uniref:Uncharacterized protein n=1 Tax=Parathielavia appendiculata TaxID=2587402 RepID=A0AAN6TW80_9PEZI|nr:hypothetical protein N657DRAFT_647376 [Parathielavia appendiculata]
MAIHLDNSWKGQQETVKTLLAAGADPCRGGGDYEHDPYDVVVRGDFLDLLEILIAFAERKDVDPRTILSDVARFKGKTAVEVAICAASWSVFSYLLTAKLGCLSDVFASGDQNALHISATIGDVRFIDPILAAGVSLTQFTPTGHRPFDFAIISRHYDYARALYEHCSPTDRESILSPDERGFPTFGRLVYSAQTTYRHVIDMEAIRLLDSLGAFSVYFNENTKDTLIRELARTAYSSTRPNSAAFDDGLLRLVVSQTPTELLNQRDEFGFAPLHYMVMNANLAGLALILDHPDVDINIVVQPLPDSNAADALGLQAGNTPLDIAGLKRHSSDSLHAVGGGAREVVAYRANVEGIIALLQEKHAREARGYFFRMMVQDALMVPESLRITYLFPEYAAPGTLWRGPRRWVDDGEKASVWPMRLGGGVDNVADLAMRRGEGEVDHAELGRLAFML